MPPLRSLLLFLPGGICLERRIAFLENLSKGVALDGSLMEAFNQAYTRGQAKNILSYLLPLPGQPALTSAPTASRGCRTRHLMRPRKEFTDHVKRLGVTAHREVLPGTVHLFITVAGQDTAFRHAVSLAEDFLRP